MVRRAAAAAVRAELPSRLDGPRLGQIVGVDREGRLLVDYEENPHGPLPAALMRAPVGPPAGPDAGGLRVGEEVVLLFRSGASDRPLIIGRVASDEPEVDGAASELAVRVDGQRVVVEGREEVVLQCGEASITLSRDGSIALRGSVIESRARYTNRLRGGSIELN